MGNRCYEWIDEPWDRVKNLILKSRMGHPRKDDRLMVNAMPWLARSGAGWADILEGYRPWKTVYSRFCKWCDEGTFLRIFEALNQDGDFVEIVQASTLFRNALGGHNMNYFEQTLMSTGFGLDNLRIGLYLPYPTINGIYLHKYIVPAYDESGNFI